VTLVANPIGLSKTPVAYAIAPRALGADTAAVLGERLHVDAATLARLAAAGTIALG
jgi:crotonobetainyl-CoA:carnitine CoA-transferase CaiB-like acyl-CoA transferase